MQELNRVCTKCGSSDFKPNGKYFRCKPCHQAQRRARYQSRRKEFDEKNKLWAEANPEKVNGYKKKWREANRGKQREVKRKWMDDNRGRVREYCANRRALKKKATPPWADRKEMRKIHKLAYERGLVVDHIVPLNSEIVCGFNTPDNLRCIPMELNSFKGNRYWPDMPKEASCF